jgi:RimJ/RimL family protein N-acetyltransferase
VSFAPPVSVPLLETPRLRLRGHGVEDYEALAAMWSDPAVVRFIGGKPFSAHETWMRLLRYPGLWALLGYGYWAIEEKASDLLIGNIGFADYKREIQPSLQGVPEVGWALASGAHGKGYATEALAAVLAWGDEHLGAQRVVCIIDAANVVSIRVAIKAGFVFSHEAALNGEAIQVYVRDKV